MGGSYFRNRNAKERGWLGQRLTSWLPWWGGEGDPQYPAPLAPIFISSTPPPQQIVYYTEMHKIFGDLTAQIDRPGLSDEQRERENDAKLSELRALSIVADD